MNPASVNSVPGLGRVIVPEWSSLFSPGARAPPLMKPAAPLNPAPALVSHPHYFSYGPISPEPSPESPLVPSDVMIAPASSTSSGEYLGSGKSYRILEEGEAVRGLYIAATPSFTTIIGLGRDTAAENPFDLSQSFKQYASAITHSTLDQVAEHAQRHYDLYVLDVLPALVAAVVDEIKPAAAAGGALVSIVCLEQGLVQRLAESYHQYPLTFTRAIRHGDVIDPHASHYFRRD